MSGRGWDGSAGMMQCPIGHPPGPQPFCPICGRQTIPVAPEAAAPPPPAPPGPGQPMAGPVEDDAPGSAAAKARDLIAQLSGQAPDAGPSSPSPGIPSPSIPNQGIPNQGAARSPAPAFGEAAPVAPYLPGDRPVPQFPTVEQGRLEEPFERTTMAGLGFPTADAPAADEQVPGPGQWSAPPGTPPVGDVPPPAQEESPKEGGSRSRLLPLLLAVVVLLIGGYLVKTQLLDSSPNQTPAQPSARASAPRAATTAIPSYSASELAASLRDPHFKHGYDAGVARARTGAVPASQWESVCRTMAFAQRDKGYPWGQHDQVGCLVALSRS